MAGEKEVVTVMILYVDLKCCSCYKKVKKLLCKFPQIRDQVFDEDKNKVTITVVCCNPEKLRDKLCCKGGKAIQSIEIVENPPPKQPQKPKPKQPPPVAVPVPVPAPAPVEKPKPKEPEKPKETEKPKPPPVVLVPTPKPDPPPKKPDPPPAVVPKPQPQPNPPAVPQPQPEPVMPMPMPDPMHGYPHQPFCPPVSVCCQECYEGRGGGPCHYGYGRPVPPPPGPCYDSNYGYQYRPCYVTRCDYFSEENPQGCSIM